MGSESGAAMQVDTPEDAPRDIRVMYRERTVVVGTAGHLIIIIIIDLIICYTNDNNPRLSTNATSRPYGRTTKEKSRVTS